MWQTIAVILIVALAAGFVVRRLRGQITGRAACCTGAGDGADQAACASCAGAASGPQALAGLAPDNQARPACGCGCSSSSRETGPQGPKEA